MVDHGLHRRGNADVVDTCLHFPRWDAARMWRAACSVQGAHRLQKTNSAKHCNTMFKIPSTGVSQWQGCRASKAGLDSGVDCHTVSLTLLLTSAVPLARP